MSFLDPDSEKDQLDLNDVLKDFPPGPLDPYRKTASFDWKEMSVTIEPEEILLFKHRVWRFMENDPVFAHSPIARSLDEERKVVLAQALRLLDQDFLGEKRGEIGDPVKVIAMNQAVGQYDWSLSTKRSIFMDFFTNAIRGLANSAYHMDVLEDTYKMRLTGCVAMTEISHGTNTKAFKTRATYDAVKGQFVLNTPSFEAAKCWSGGLGKCATHAFLMAQLYTPDGVCHGIHGFIVPIRDPKTLLPFPGVTIFDMGAKIGLNGLDNGVMLFDNYAISRDALLNRTGGVTPEGQYVTKIKDAKKRFGVALGNTSAARIGIIAICSATLVSAVTISIRYSAVRRQFGPSNAEEIPVLEYQMQQWRLFPYLAATYVMKFMGDSVYGDFVNFVMSSYNPDLDPDVLSNMGQEIHALSASGKPIAGWLARDAIQESREACGGHGYLRCAGLGQLRNDHDANVTYEGDNNVLLQQTSNWLLSVWANPKREELATRMPLGTLSFLTRRVSGHLKGQTVEDILKPDALLDAYKWLVCHLLQTTAEKVSLLSQSGRDAFETKNESQVYAARTLSIAFIEHYSLEIFWTKLIPKSSPGVRPVLTKLLLLYGYWSLEKHLSSLYQGGFTSSQDTATLVRNAVLELCSQLKPEAVALVDAIAPPDFILNSALGQSDGEIYKNLRGAMAQTPGGFERDDYWKDIVLRIKSNL